MKLVQFNVICTVTGQTGTVKGQICTIQVATGTVQGQAGTFQGYEYS